MTPEEHATIERWNAQRLLDLLADRIPLLVTDLTRPSITDDPRCAAAIEEGVLREGSSTDGLFVKDARWRTKRRGPT